MSCTILCIGTELLTGEILNTNARFIGRQLTIKGIVVDTETTVPDEASAIKRALTAALERSQLVITVGGLGPTRDDITKQAVADALGLQLEFNEELATTIRKKYEAYSTRDIPDSSWQRQATIPAGAEILPNEWGTAPGLWCRHRQKAVAMLPGPPRELVPMFGKHLLGQIIDFIPPTIVRRRLAVFGLGESNTEQQVISALQDFPMVEPAYCAKSDCCHVRLSVAAGEEAALDHAYERLRRQFGDLAASCDVSLAELVCDLVRSRNGRLGTAESCTGGGIAKAITEVAGVSDVFQGGIVTYSNDLKMQCLGVAQETLAEHGAVSRPVSLEMVQGLLKHYDLTVGVAVTGIAGPTGAAPGKPVGTVHIATAVDADQRHHRHVFNYGRSGMRERTILAALRQLHQHLLARTPGKIGKS